jgi:phage gp36-like protein
MAYPYITQAQLENRLSATRVARIYDDNRDGSADANPIAQLIADASGKVASYLRGSYDLDTVAASTPNEVVRLTLDVAFAMAAQRHPEVVRVDWQPLMQAAEKDLERLRKGETRLDVVGPPEPAANTGGAVYQQDPNDATVDALTFFANGFGIY